MTFFDWLLILWLTMFLWRTFGALTGFFTRKEFYSVSVINDVLHGLLSALFMLRSSHWWSFAFWAFAVYVDVRDARRNYRKWKDEDDDEDKRRRRWSWAKNKLPKPVTRVLENPT